MSRATLGVAFALLHPFVPAATIDPETFRLGTREFSVLINKECSGVEGLALMLVFTSVWLWVHRMEWRFPRALLLVPIGLSLVWLFNCVRIAVLVFIGVAGAPGVAVGGFHSQAGWLGFNAVAISICLAARYVPWLTTADGSSAPESMATSNPTATYLMPFLALLGAGMISGLGTDTFEWFYPIRVVAVAAVLWHFRQHYRELNWRVGGAAVGLGVVVFAVWLALEPLVSSASPTAMPGPLREAPQGIRNAWLALRILGSVVTVPIAEELAFRGFLLRRLVSDDFENVSHVGVMSLAILVSSCAFGFLHGERWLAGTLAGILYAAAYLRRGSIGDATAAHATTNALIAGWALGGGQWQLW
jgi:exosortase E/protease (VPEID-CTERM system)